MYPRLPAWEELQALAIAARTGSISAAAREAATQQQTMSARITRAERALGVRVFTRSPYGITPTPEGAALLDALPALSRAASGLLTTARALAEPGTLGELRVAASNTVAELHYPGWAATFHLRFPAVHLRMIQENSDGVRAAVSSGEADIGFVEGGDTPRDLAAAPVGTDELIVVVPPGHGWATRRVSERELRDTPLVMREHGSGTRDVVETALGELAEPAGEFGSLASQRAGIVALGAPGVIARGAVADHLKLGKLVEVDTLTFARELRAVWRRGSEPGAEARALITIAGA
ncbi:LysR family transcriptional regulator [Corynebacterium sp. UBA2622]|uniref:LysR family transcriptional regulator n=1 Tax=Corynebacterium sp. UBA2622 TaxID=1946393 RepID=UPI0025C23B54|nr:LysR family transcriptional regulator [Corynebacterium sp. UBA2622]